MVDIVKDEEYDFVINHNKEHFDALERIVKETGETMEGNCFYQDRSFTKPDDLKNKQKNLYSLGKLGGNILEIGFNAGHSCLLFLIANPFSKLFCFDICCHTYTNKCYDYLNKHFPDRISFYEGDSNKTLEQFNRNDMDILHIDGAHDYNTANTDFMLCRNLCKNEAIVIWDDVWIGSLGALWSKYVGERLVFPFSLLPTPMYSHAFGRMILKKPRIALVSLALGDNYKVITKYGSVTKRQYCEKHGYDFFENDIEVDPLRPPAWAKVRQILLHLGRYDYIMWIDADTFVMNQNVRIEDLMVEEMNGRDIMIARDWKMINSGVMIIRNTPWARRFFELVYEQTQFIHHSNWEQAAIIDLYEKNISNAQDHFTVLPLHKQNRLNSYWYTYKFTTCYILHFPGCWRDNTDMSLSVAMERYCPIRKDDESEESYQARLHWLEFESEEDARRRLRNFKEN